MPTVPIDSIAPAAAADSIVPTADAARQLPKEWPRTSHLEDAPDHLTGAVYTTGRADYLYGIPGEPRPLLPGYDSMVVCLLIGLFIFITVNFKHYSTFLKTLSQELLSVRRRANVFNEQTTVSETRILMSMILLVCFSEASLLFSLAYTRGFTLLPISLTIVSMLGVTVAYYALQVLAYYTVGYTFTDTQSASQWLRGFNASQAFLGIALVIPALVTLFYPGTSTMMFTVGAILYVAARIVFICKGFKIFYHNLFSLIYFILYLCALEIAPLVVFYRMGELISSL